MKKNSILKTLKIYFFLPLLLLTLLNSCTKWDKLTSAEEGNVYMARAYADRNILTVYKVDSFQAFTFGASLAGFNGASNDQTVTFQVDTSLVAKYNEEYYYLNTEYKTLPTDAYKLSSLTTTIKAGSTDSDTLSLLINGGNLSTTENYMIPIRIVSTSNGSKIDSVLGTTYFKIEGVTIRSRDITSQGMFSVSNENENGKSSSEGSPKLVDGNVATKYLLFTFKSGMWAQLQYSSAVSISAYTLTSANDASGRDPKTWQLQASDDGTKWTVIDDRENELFTSRQQTRTFELNSSDGLAHLYYRLVINANNGDALFQLAEWRMLQYY